MHTILILGLLLGVAAPRDPRGLWFLERSERGPEEGALLEALRIYTRDLDIPITLRRIPGRLRTEGEQKSFAQNQCSLNAIFVVWFGDYGDKLHIIECKSKEDSRIGVSPDDELAVTAQTLALKVRGLLVESLGKGSRVEPYAEGALGPDDGADRQAPAPALEAPQETGSPTSSVVTATNTAWERGIEIGLFHVLGSAATASGVRQGLALRLGFVLMNMPLALEWEGIFHERLVRENAGLRVVARETPFSVSLLLRRRSSRFLMAAGPQAGVHFLAVEGRSEDGRSGASQAAALLLGVCEQLRFSLGSHWNLSILLSQRAILPRREWTVDGQDQLRIGLFQWSFYAGIIYGI